MSGYVITVHPDGRVTAEPHRAKTSVEQTQEAVGGDIEIVPLMQTVKLGALVRALGLPDLSEDVQPCIALCNEEGKLNGLPLNSVATQLWAEALVRGRYAEEQPDGRIPLSDVLVGPVAFVVGAAAIASWN